MVQGQVTGAVYDKHALEGMPRQRLQQIAKKEGIKASLKSTEIIRGLLKKYPGGLPRAEKPVVTIKTIEKPRLQNFQPTAYGGSSLWDSSSDESCTFESRKFRMDMSAMQHSKEARKRAAAWAREVAGSGEPEEEAAPRIPSPPPVPGPKDVRQVRRDLTKLINELPSLQADIDSAQALIETAADRLRDTIGTLRELVSTRNAIESSIVQRMKDDQRLWDGTYHLESENDIKTWSEFLLDAREAARKEEEEERARDELQMGEARRQQEAMAAIAKRKAENKAKRREERRAARAKLALIRAPPVPEPEPIDTDMPCTRSNKRKRGHL